MKSVPFPADHAIYSDLQPLSADNPSDHDHAWIDNILARELSTPLLDNLHDHLWFVARRDFRNIDAMHRQLIKGRKVFVTEDCRLHMVWDESRIFLKPIPVWLMSDKFWLEFLSDSSTPSRTGLTMIGSDNRARALGLLRSYAYLIQHHSDLVMAKKSLLVPDEISWQSFERFISHFREVDDAVVAPRYRYGQLRLSRLNWAVRVFRPPEAQNCWFYELPYWSTTPYVKAATVPLAFAFAGVSLTLSSMQVMVGTPTSSLEFASLNESGIKAMDRAYWFFSLFIIILSGVGCLLFLGIPLCVVIWQVSFGYANRGKQAR